MKRNKKKDLAITAVESQPLSWVDSHIRLLLPVVLFGAMLIRLLAHFNFSQSLYGDFLIWDERTYHAWATHLLAGKPFSAQDFGPLPAYLMATVYWIFGTDPDHIRILNILFGTFTCLFIYFIGRDLANRRIGILACTIAALYKPFVFFSITILKESLALFLFSAATWLFISLMKESETPRLMGKRPLHSIPAEAGVRGSKHPGIPAIMVTALLLGVTAGLLIYVRQNCIALLPLFPLLLLWGMRKRPFPVRKGLLTLAFFLIGLLVAVSPFLIQNHRATGQWRASPAGGFNLYLANNPDNPYPYYRPASFSVSVPAEQAIQFTIEASRRVGKKLSTDEASSYWTQEVFRTAREHPGPFARRLWQKTLVLLNHDEAEDNYNLGFISRFVPFFRLPFPAFWFVFPLGMAWMILSLGRSRKDPAPGLIFLIYASTLILFFSNMRIRIPLLVILIPYAAMGLDGAFRFFKRQLPKKAGYRLLILVALLAVIQFLPVAGTGDLSGHYNTHAINLASKGFHQEAIRFWEHSSGMNRPYSAYANHALASLFLQRGDLKSAKRWLALIPDASFAAAQKHELMGDILIREGRTSEAIAAYRRSLSINAGQRGVYAKMIRLLETTDPSEAVRLRQQLSWVSSFYPAP